MPTLGQRLKQLVSQGVIFGLTSSLQSALSFILLPLYTKYFSLDEFGGYNMLLVIAGLCNTIFYLGASSVLGRFYYDYKEKSQDKEIVSAALWLSMLGGGILIGLALLLAQPISIHYLKDPSFSLPFVLCMIGNAMSYPVTTLTLLLRYKKKSLFYLITTLSGLLLNFAITISILMFTDIKVCAPFIGLICSNAIILTALIFNSRADLTFKVSKQYYRTEIVFGVQFVLSSLLAYAYGSLDKFVIKEALSVADVGIYSLGFRIGSLYHILIYLPFTLVWSPLRMEYRKSEDNAFFIKKIATYYTIGSMIFIVACIVWGNDILAALFPQQEYAVSLQVFPLIMIGYLFYGWTDIFNFGVYVNNKFLYLSLVPIIGAIINCGLNILLLPRFGVAISAYIYMFTYFVAAMMLYAISNKYYKLPMEWIKLASAVMLILACFFMLNIENITFGHSFVGKIVISIVLFALTWFFLTDKNEKERAIAYVKRFKK